MPNSAPIRSSKSQAARKPTLLLADDHAVFVEALRRILEPEFEIVGSAPDGRTMVSEVLRLKPDGVLADITMPMLNGIEAARQLRKSGSPARIIFLSMHADPAYVAQCLEAGAKGYLLKESAASELFEAIRQVLGGKTYVTAGMAAAVKNFLEDPPPAAAKENVKLTPRQREVLQLVAEGKTAKEIAAILRVSHRTAEFHKLRIMKEMGMHTTAELTRLAIKNRVLDP